MYTRTHPFGLIPLKGNMTTVKFVNGSASKDLSRTWRKGGLSITKPKRKIANKDFPELKNQDLSLELLPTNQKSWLPSYDKQFLLPVIIKQPQYLVPSSNVTSCCLYSCLNENNIFPSPRYSTKHLSNFKHR